MRHLREKIGIAVQVHMSEIDGDHVVTVTKIVREMIVLAVKILAVINGEVRLIGAHAVGIDLHHPDKLHILVPEIDLLHILIGNAAAQHHDLFEIRHIGEHVLDLRGVLHGERDVRELDLLGVGRERDAEKLRFPDRQNLRMRRGEGTQRVLRKAAGSERNALCIGQKHERRADFGEVFLRERRAGKVERQGVRDEGLAGKRHVPDKAHGGKLLLQRKLALQRKRASGKRQRFELRQTDERRAQLLLRSVVDDNVLAVAVKALSGERDGPEHTHLRQRSAQRENGGNIAARAHIGAREIFKSGKGRDIPGSEIRRHDVLALAVERFAANGDVPENVRVRQLFACFRELFGGDILSAQIDRFGAAGDQLPAHQRIIHPDEHTCRDKQHERRRKNPDPSFFLHGISFRKGSPYTGESFF